MTEANTADNVRELPGGNKDYDEFYSLREPTIEDTVNLAGALLRNADAETVAMLASEKSEMGIYDLFLRAVADDDSRNRVLMVLTDLWRRDVDVETPFEDWDYEPDPKKVESGNTLSRDEMWRTLSRSTRRRMVKRYTLGKLSYKGWAQFYKAFVASTDVSDFLGSVQEFVKARSGGSTTDSPQGTATTDDG